MGYLGVNDTVFCYQLNILLQEHIGRTLMCRIFLASINRQPRSFYAAFL